jgi:hypothetical protein|tara:strand:+ start:558 stop:1463 length:906 start_codon:yes stop_codon:yes gene_type:complete
MALTNTGTAAGGLGRTIGDAVIAFNHVNVMYPLVSVQQAAQGSNHVQFSDWTKLASSDVTAATQATTTTAVAITTAARTATISEHVIASTVSDLVLMGSGDDVEGQAGPALGNAVAAKLDDDLVELGKTFSQTECGAGSSLALSHIFGSMRQLRAAGAPMPYNLVLSPKQVWGGKGIISLLHNSALDTAGSSTTDTATARPVGMMGGKAEEAFSTGYVGSIAGFNIYWSDQIDENVGSGGDAAGFAFSKGGVGLGVGADGLFRIAAERDEMLRATNYVATGFWGEVEIKDAYGVYILSDVS